MTPERWQRIKQVAFAALELEEEERAAFLDKECATDRDLRENIEGLLEEDQQPGGSIEKAIAAAAAQVQRAPGAPATESMLGRTISHYKITEKLGEGGMGVVYKAEDSKLRRTVALKLPPLDQLAAEEAKARFVREAQAAAALNDPNICTVHEIDEADGRTFIAMEFVAGQNVKDKVRDGALPLDEALDIAIQAARALQTAHEEGIVHRDVKSANLMVTAQGQVKVMDFGLAQVGDRSQLTLSGTTLGTPAYMSPEQTQAQPTDRRTDIWSLGVVLYEMVTGQLPFHGEVLAAVTYAVVNTEPEPPSALRSGLPSELDQVIAKALAKDPAERYQHVDEMLEDLRVLEGQIGAPSSSTKPSKKPSTAAHREAVARTRRRRWAWALGVAAAAAVVTIAGLSVGNFLPTAEAPLEPLRPVPLTTYPGFEGNPSFSPDGNQVAFSWNEQRDNWDIYVQLIGLGDPLRLTTDPASDLSPAWSPDGQRIAFLRGTPARGTAEVFLVPALGGQERKLAETRVLGVRTLGTCLNWSPDSRWLAVCDADDSDSVLSLFLLSVDSGEKRRLTWPPEGSMGGDFSPAFSPDGRMLAFTRFVTGLFSDLYLLDLGDDLIPRGEPRRQTFTERTTTSPVFTPDGRDIIFAAGMIDAPSLWRVPASGAAPPERLSIGERALFPAISRRGNRAAYENVNVLEGDIWRADLPMTEGGAIKLNSSSRDDIDPRYSPDGKSIAFVSSRAGSLEIWKCDSDGSNAVQLTSLGASITAQPRWVPDGNSIGFLSDAEGQFDVYVVNADGGGASALDERRVLKLVEGRQVDLLLIKLPRRSQDFQDAGRGRSARPGSCGRGRPYDGITRRQAVLL